MQGYPTLYKGSFTITGAPSDSFLKMDDWNKGIAWINGFNLGRYWQTEGPQQTLFVPAPRLVAGVNELVVLELHNTSSDLSLEFVEQPVLQKPPKGMACDPTVPASVSADVRMVSESAKLAHQQQWLMQPDGSVQLKVQPQPGLSICFTVTPGCPHASSGCITVQACTTPPSAEQVFDLKPDPTKAGSHHLVQRSTNHCVDIFSNDNFDGAPLDMWPCDTPGEPNQRFSYDAVMGHIATEEVGSGASPLVVTVCTSK
jgi:hypothetical protein